MLFCEAFQGFILVLVFLTLKLRLANKERDFVLVGGAIAATSYCVTYITKDVSGTFANPALSFSELMGNWFFIDRIQHVTVFGHEATYALYNLQTSYVVIRLIGPFLGAIVAAVFFVYQKQMMKEAEQAADSCRVDGNSKVAPSSSNQKQTSSGDKGLVPPTNDIHNDSRIQN